LSDAVAGLYGLVNGDTSNVLMGLASNDVLTGGAGVDTFEFDSQFGNVTITDFDASQDVIQFNPALFANYSAVIASTQQNGANTVITFDANDTITLTNVATASLSPANFTFA
jgi:Ca2+-binding RTX toxin-like protein